MKKAFIGLSSPICYDYGFEHLMNDTFALPNPVLDSPMGLFLFYDELWFFDRNVCPYNCKDLPYVKFLSEEYNLAKLELERFVWDNLSVEKLIARENLITWNMYWDAVRTNLDYDLSIQPDTRGINGSGNRFKINKAINYPRPNVRNLLMDDFLASYFKLELITNSMTSDCLSVLTTSSTNTPLKLRLTQQLLCENIPNFQLKFGPYHPFIEDLRSDSLLKNFKKKIDRTVAETPKKEVDALKAALESAMNKYLYELVLSNIDKKQIYKSTASTIFGQVPILGNIYGAIEGGAAIYDTIRDRKESGWMGFIAKARLQH